MGIRYRKSINLGGGFRINLSKSGIGYSWGVKGYRKTITANGKSRSTYSIPGTGLSYVNEKSNRKKDKPSPTPVEKAKDNNLYDTEYIENGNIADLIDDNFETFRASIEKALKLDHIANILMISFVFLWIGILLKIYVRIKGKIDLHYDMDDYYTDIFNERVNAWQTLSRSSRLWSIHQTSKVIDKRYHSGASNVLNRAAMRIITTQPFYLRCDNKIFTFQMKNENIIVLPDVMLIIKNRKVGIVSHDDIEYSVCESRFIEEEGVPRDSEIVDKTWKYVNKNGTPDKRMKDNRELPICLYAEINMSSDTGLNMVVLSSNVENAFQFVNIMQSK